MDVLKKLFFALFTIIIVSFPTFATQISDKKPSEAELKALFANNVFRLWLDNDYFGKRYAECTGFYWRPVPLSDYSYILTAGHCAHTKWIRFGEDQWEAVKFVKYENNNFYDYAIGLVRDRRPQRTFFKDPEREPLLDEIALTNKAKFRWDEKAETQKARITEIKKEGFLSESYVEIVAEYPIVGGMSGSPVISLDGGIVGVVVSTYGDGFRSIFKAAVMPAYNIPKIPEK